MAFGKKLTSEEILAQRYRDNMASNRRFSTAGQLLSEASPEVRAAYEAMLQQVNAWQPPSDEHCGLRDFMRDQIEQSIKFDDSTDYLGKPTEIKTVEDWLVDKKSEALKNIKYHREEYAKEVERTAKRNEWVESLRNSLQCKR